MKTKNIKMKFSALILLSIWASNETYAQKEIDSLESNSAIYDLFQYVEPYATIPKGELELHYRFEHIVYGAEHGANPFPNQWGHRTGIEMGLSSKLMFEAFVNFRQPEDQSEKNKLANASFSLRYRIFEQNKFFIDPAAIIEYKQGFSGAGSGIEGKIVLSKDIGKFNITGNFGVESSGVEAGGSNKSGFEFVVNGGIAYQFNYWLAVGGEYENEFLGPTIGVRLKNFRLNLSAGGSKEGQPSKYPTSRIRLVYRIR